MKKKTAALLLGSALTVTALGGVGIHSYAANLTVAGEEETETAADQGSTDTVDQDSSQAAEDPSSEGTDASAQKLSYTSLNVTETADENASDYAYTTVADVAEACLPSIVSITDTTVQEVQNFFSGQSYQYETQAAGTGIILGENDTELLICTNNHVVEDATDITVTFVDDESVSAQLKGTDSANDLAVVAVNLSDIPDDTMNQIKIAQTGDSDDMRIGEQVVAIGNALGYGQSVTTGIISAKDRSIEVSEDGYSVSNTYEDLIQTDAAINAGNSGGALLNMNGEVIGINSAKASASGVEGMGYAIPISKALPILQELMSKETRSKVDDSEVGYMGISGQSVSSDAVSLYGIPSGVYVTSVEEGSPAEEAGLQESDIITAFDGETVESMDDLQRKIQYYAAGETVDLTVSTNRNGAYEEETISITLGSRTENTQ